MTFYANYNGMVTIPPISGSHTIIFDTKSILIHRLKTYLTENCDFRFQEGNNKSTFTDLSKLEEYLDGNEI